MQTPHRKAPVICQVHTQNLLAVRRQLLHHHAAQCMKNEHLKVTQCTTLGHYIDCWFWWNHMEQHGIVHEVTYYNECTSLPPSLSYCLGRVLWYSLSITHLVWCFSSSLFRSFLVYHIRHIPKRLSTAWRDHACEVQTPVQEVLWNHCLWKCKECTILFSKHKLKLFKTEHSLMPWHNFIDVLNLAKQTNKSSQWLFAKWKLWQAYFCYVVQTVLGWPGKINKRKNANQ